MFSPGSTTSFPSHTRCCHQWRHHGSRTNLITTSGSTSGIELQYLDMSFFRFQIIVGRASFLSLWSISLNISKKFDNSVYISFCFSGISGSHPVASHHHWIWLPPLLSCLLPSAIIIHDFCEFNSQ